MSHRFDKKLGINIVLSISIIISFIYIASTLEYHQKWGINVVGEFQKYRTTWLDKFMRIGSFLGLEFIVVCLPLMIWSGKYPLANAARRLLTLLIYVFYVSTLLKLYFLEPRPHSVNSSFTVDSSGKREWSFPSGHSMASSSCWYFFANEFRRTKLYILAFLLPIFTCLSRVYFAVHYVHDVFVGWSCGIVTIIFYHYARNFFRFKWRHLISSLIMLIIALQFDEKTANHQLGLWFVPCYLFGEFLVEDKIGYNLLFELEFSFIDFVLRALIGLPMVLSTFLIWNKLEEKLVLKCITAIIMPIGLYWLAPKIFLSLKNKKQKL